MYLEGILLNIFVGIHFLLPYSLTLGYVVQGLEFRLTNGLGLEFRLTNGVLKIDKEMAVLLSSFLPLFISIIFIYLLTYNLLIYSYLLLNMFRLELTTLSSLTKYD